MPDNFKDFDTWNVKKQQLDSRAANIYFRERQVWFCSIGLNIGFEENGKNNEYERPILIYKKFSQRLFWGIALTTKLKPNNKYYVGLKHKNNRFSAIVSQLRLYDVNRLQRYIYIIDQPQFKKLQMKIRKIGI